MFACVHIYPAAMGRAVLVYSVWRVWTYSRTGNHVLEPSQTFNRILEVRVSVYSMQVPRTGCC